MLPEDLYHYYSYEGSLTTPPCTENVHWFMLADFVKLSKAQVMHGITSPKSPLLIAWLARVLPKPSPNTNTWVPMVFSTTRLLCPLVLPW